MKALILVDEMEKMLGTSMVVMLVSQQAVEKESCLVVMLESGWAPM